MKKADLIAKIAEDADIKKSEAEAALNSVAGCILSNLKAGVKFPWGGIGTFTVNHRPARDGRNPATGKPMKIAAKNVVKFKAAKALTEELN